MMCLKCFESGFFAMSYYTLHKNIQHLNFLLLIKNISLDIFWSHSMHVYICKVMTILPILANCDTMYEK